jgi:thymidylate kinase
LVIDKDTLVERLATRTTNDYGKQPHEVDEIKGWHKNYEKQYQAFGATIVDATQPVEKVTDQILASVEQIKDSKV